MGYLMSAQTIAGLANALDYGKSWLYPPAPPDAQPADKGAGAGADSGVALRDGSSAGAGSTAGKRRKSTDRAGKKKRCAMGGAAAV